MATTQKTETIYRGQARKVMDRIGNLLEKEGVEIAEERSFSRKEGSSRTKVVELTLSGDRIQDPYKWFWFKKRLAAAAKEIGAEVQVDRMKRKGEEITAQIVIT